MSDELQRLADDCEQAALVLLRAYADGNITLGELLRDAKQFATVRQEPDAFRDEIKRRVNLIDSQYMGCGGNLRDSEVVRAMRAECAALLAWLDAAPATERDGRDALREVLQHVRIANGGANLVIEMRGFGGASYEYAGREEHSIGVPVALEWQKRRDAALQETQEPGK